MKKALEIKFAIKKMQQLDKEIETGKKKLLTAKEALGAYSKYLA